MANTPTGIQNVVTGLFFAARLDVDNFISSRRVRSGATRAISPTPSPAGGSPRGSRSRRSRSTTSFWSQWEWDQEYNNVKLANNIVASIPNISPAYPKRCRRRPSPGVVRDDESPAVHDDRRDARYAGRVISYSAGASTPQPIYCNRDVWRYIVALLDSANADLNAAGAIPLPVVLPSGFGAVGLSAAPSTAPGAFAAFNRALAGKAGLQLAYAIARQAGAGPTASTSGTPDATALARADSAIKASALFNPSAITTPAAGGFSTSDAYGVYHVFSGQSGDLTNTVNGEGGTFDVLWDLVADVDTVNDLRWKAKFAANGNTVQQPTFAPVASPYVYAYYPSVSTPIPIVRNEELTLVDAQIQLGLGAYAATRRRSSTTSMCKPAGTRRRWCVPADYLDVRETALLKEQRYLDGDRGEWGSDDLDPDVRHGRGR